MNRTLQVSVETALRVVYQPQAVFRVRPVSRCTASMPGEYTNISPFGTCLLPMLHCPSND